MPGRLPLNPGRPVARRTIAEWLAGDTAPRYERQARALMTLVDEGRLPIAIDNPRPT